MLIAAAFRFTPLHCAAANGRLEVVSLLVKRGANINAVDGNGFTALDLAISDGEGKVRS